MSMKSVDISNNEVAKHSISLVQGEKMTITSVKNVPSFDPNEIMVVLNGEKLKIEGDNLEIDRLDIEAETLVVTGKVKSLVYSKGDFKTGLIKKIFK